MDNSETVIIRHRQINLSLMMIVIYISIYLIFFTDIFGFNESDDAFYYFSKYSILFFLVISVPIIIPYILGEIGWTTIAIDRKARQLVKQRQLLPDKSWELGNFDAIVHDLPDYDHTEAVRLKAGRELLLIATIDVAKRYYGGVAELIGYLKELLDLPVYKLSSRGKQYRGSLNLTPESSSDQGNIDYLDGDHRDYDFIS